MPIAAASVVLTAGGEYASGPTDGQYHIVVNDATAQESKNGRPQAVLDLVVKDDPNHQAKEGKRLLKHFISFPAAEDDEDKKKVMKGMLKRQLYDGFGVEWPKKSDEAIDLRDWVSLQAWVLIGKREYQGESRSQVIAIAQTQEALPLPKGAARPAGAGATATGTQTPAKTNGRRR